MTVGIIGLGLIGGSLARAYAKAGHTVYAAEKDRDMLAFAQLAGTVHGTLDEHNIRLCDLLLLAIYPDGCASWLEENAHLVSPDALVLDLCGIKEEICRRCFPLAEAYGFTFVGGHPMAGSQFSGFKYSREDLFDGAPMVLCPPNFFDIRLLDEAKKLKGKYDSDMLKQIMHEMENWKPLLKKSVSAYMTIINWCNREKDRA